MTKRRTYRIRIEVEHYSRDEAIRKFEDMVFKAKVDGWKPASLTDVGTYPFPKTATEVGPIVLSVEDRLARIEAEFDRLGGLAEENAA